MFLHCRQMILSMPSVPKFRLNHSISHPFYEINVFLHCTQKFQMAAKGGLCTYLLDQNFSCNYTVTPFPRQTLFGILSFTFSKPKLILLSDTVFKIKRFLCMQNFRMASKTGKAMIFWGEIGSCLHTYSLDYPYLVQITLTLFEKNPFFSIYTEIQDGQLYRSRSLQQGQRSNQGHTMTLHTYTPNQFRYQISTSYTLRFPRYSPDKIL